MHIQNELLLVPEIKTGKNGILTIIPSEQSAQSDFDFFEGKWNLKNRKLKTRLNNCTEWEEFESTQEMYKIINGLGNIDNFLTNVNGQAFEGMSLRLFNPKSRLWSIYWADSNRGVLDPPVVGSFENGIGHYFARDVFENKNILVVFRWDARDKNNPIWSQAFSANEGIDWEWNWFMFMSRINAKN